MTSGIIIIGMLVCAGFIIPLMLKLSDHFFGFKPATMQDYIFKIARVTGTSEYEVFCKSAESWPVARETIERDFHAYLSRQSVPYYVTDFIRKNKEHIDRLHTPRIYY